LASAAANFGVSTAVYRIGSFTEPRAESSNCILVVARRGKHLTEYLTEALLHPER